GILFQNRGTSFSLDENSPNVFQGGKRPRHTLMPVLVFKDDDLVFVPATMGGSAQPQIHTQLLLRSIAGSSPQEATHSPRWVLREPDSEGLVTILAEEDLPPETKQSLKNTGFNVETLPQHSERLGHSNLIKISNGGYTAASDPRSDGSAIIIE
ncbi:MAG TPA: gamma-glutamyltransferase, partial [Microbacteriaceae bacterium]|nr:gamma-glutamyltransferase [Microbacteriaceae bacterium]